MTYKDDKRSGVSAVWLCCFLRDAPPGTQVRGYEGEFNGLVVEVPVEPSEPNGACIELAYIHNNCSVEITEEGRRWLSEDQAFEI